MGEEAIVACRDITVGYGSIRALDKVTLGLGVTGVTGLVGVNGAGKTTLIHALLGLVPNHVRAIVRSRRLREARLLP